MHACTGTNTANLSEPIACMNRSIASTLPRTWQDINNSLDPTAASNWQLSSIKRYTSESRPPLHPPPSKPAVVFSLNEADDKITLLDEFQLVEHIKRGEFLFVHHVMLWNMVAGSLKSLSIFNDSSCLQNSLPKCLSPSLALRQWCQLAVVHDMWKKMTGSFLYLLASKSLW